jgi:hypothetical protein
MWNAIARALTGGGGFGGNGRGPSGGRGGGGGEGRGDDGEQPSDPPPLLTQPSPETSPTTVARLSKTKMELGPIIMGYFALMMATSKILGLATKGDLKELKDDINKDLKRLETKVAGLATKDDLKLYSLSLAALSVCLAAIGVFAPRR